MTTITIAQAAEMVDRFESLLTEHGISVPRHQQTGADMLPLWRILELIRKGDTVAMPSGHEEQYRAALAVHDLAAKVLAVERSEHFPKLIEHLKLLSAGAVHLTGDPPANSDVYNKMIELYWACLLIDRGVVPNLDPPTRGSDGTNPDVIALDDIGKPRHGYAFKTIRSMHTESLKEHIVKGVDQIQASGASTGIVCLNLTPRPEWKQICPPDDVFTDYRAAANAVIHAIRNMVGAIARDNGQAAVDAIFASRKAVGAVCCVVFLPILAKSPETGRPTFMPLKIATLVGLTTGVILPPTLETEVIAANEAMQRTLLV